MYRGMQRSWDISLFKKGKARTRWWKKEALGRGWGARGPAGRGTEATSDGAHTNPKVERKEVPKGEPGAKKKEVYPPAVAEVEKKK